MQCHLQLNQFYHPDQVDTTILLEIPVKVIPTTPEWFTSVFSVELFGKD